MTRFASSAGLRRAKTAKVTAQIFEDPQSLALLDHMQKIAPSEASILIGGATGTGKELVARHIHHLSHRRDGPFLAVNCGAFADSLVEAELFGHEKGAFVGALSAQAGWFEEANGGTLFLDEIGDLPLAIQVKLLRVLQEREVVRLGSRRSVSIDVRVLAATNIDLAEAIHLGRFREDLFYRLNVVSLQLLPLRERSGDILPLARHFIHQYCTRLGYHPMVLSDEACQQLIQYAWPGNIRELENVIHHALLVCAGDRIQAADINLQRSVSKAERPIDTRALSTDERLNHALEALVLEANGPLHGKVEDALIRMVYRHCRYNQVHSAELLGLSRNVIRAHLIRLGELVVNKRQK